MNRIAIPKPRLDIRDLELVLAIASSGSTVKAATELHVTQSAVSRGLLLAEEKLGAKVFERTPRGLVPTVTGERLIGGALPVLAQLVELERHVCTPLNHPIRVRLVCECYTAYRWLPSTLAKLRKSMKSLEVTLHIEHTHSPVAGLLAGEIDIALLTTSPTPTRGAFEEMPLFSDEIVFIVSKDHPLADRASITRQDLVDYPIITSAQTPKPETRWFTDRAFGKKGPKPKHRPLRFPLTEAIIDAARAGMGIAVMSEWIATTYLVESSDLVLLRLNSKPLRRPWRIAYRKEMTEAAKRLAAALERAAPKVYG